MMQRKKFPMKVKILTIFPEIFPGFLGCSLTGKALDRGLWKLETVNIRDYAFDRHGSVDDTPCGGGAGMIMRPDVLDAALKANYDKGRLIYMSPRGEPLTQAKVHELSLEEEITVVCGRFEGVDERARSPQYRRNQHRRLYSYRGRAGGYDYAGCCCQIDSGGSRQR